MPATVPMPPYKAPARLADLGKDTRKDDKPRRSLAELASETWPAQMAREAYNAFTLPGDVYAGRAKADEIVPRANSLAGLVGLGAQAVPDRLAAERAGQVVGMFAGRNAKTANLSELGRAEQMASAGASRDDIWNATGWFQGADGKWRFEIDDSKSFYRGLPAPSPKSHAEFLSQGGDTVGRQFMHDRLYEAYPDLQDIRFQALSGQPGPSGYQGLYTPSANGEMKAAKIDVIGPGGGSTVLHELQHAIQQKEGFAQGGNPDIMPGISKDMRWRAAREAYEASSEDAALLRELGVDVEDAPLKPWDELTNREKLKWLEAGRNRIYHQLSGEVEARNTQSRVDMDAAQRRSKAPWATQDVADESQIVIRPARLTPKEADAIARGDLS